ncbi:ganglioside-induced differentiation-associated protein 1-like [Mytilus californianus]|uniref:ganglioside-induced differentiation-associated protein 1-like n=1 Tax=Mytilus californianus TaxID=6549 RepID=UPI0022480821|nr:ganglioside-induced differentiation-associated protein 1-like [Mytilus californianus]
MSTSRFTLYYYYSSFCSQKVLLALFEKDCRFNRKLVNLHTGEQNSPDYMRINSDGLVPVLKDGEKIIVESDKIIEYIDKEVKSGPKLIPDPNTSADREVQRLRNLMADINVRLLTFGVIANQELSISGVKMPRIFLKIISGRSGRDMVTNLERNAVKYPDLRQAYLTKAEKTRRSIDDAFKKENVVKCLDDTERTFDQLEESLQSSQAGVSGKEYWLTGSQFNVADIILAVIMDRLTILGLEDRFFSKSRRPLLFDYQQRIGQKKSVKMLRTEAKKIGPLLLLSGVKSVAPYVGSVAVLALAIGAGIWYLKNK